MVRFSVWTSTTAPSRVVFVCMVSLLAFCSVPAVEGSSERRLLAEGEQAVLACNSSQYSDVGTPFESAVRHCYAPADLVQVYGVDRLHDEGVTGKNQTIVIITYSANSTVQDDLDVAIAAFGLAPLNVTLEYPDGQPADPLFNGTVQHDVTADVLAAHAFAPDAAVVVVVPNKDLDADEESLDASLPSAIRFVAESYPGAVVSIAVAVPELAVNTSAYVDVFALAAASNLTLLAPSGDSGSACAGTRNVSDWAEWDRPSRRHNGVDDGPENETGPHGDGHTAEGPCVNFPASSPDVTAVGGSWVLKGWRWAPLLSTEDFEACLEASGNESCLIQYLNWEAAPEETVQVAWNDEGATPGSGVSGGGRSVVYRIPAFQASTVNGGGRSLNRGRAVPDVSLSASSNGGLLVYSSRNSSADGGRWNVAGGTSVAAAAVAGVVALANEKAAEADKAPVGPLNKYVYKLPKAAFMDIVPQVFSSDNASVDVDSNELVGSGVPGYNVTVGYDLVTGRGSVRGYEFVGALVDRLPSSQGPVPTPAGLPTAGPLPTGGPGPVSGYSVDFVPANGVTAGSQISSTWNVPSVLGPNMFIGLYQTTSPTNQWYAFESLPYPSTATTGTWTPTLAQNLEPGEYETRLVQRTGKSSFEVYAASPSRSVAPYATYELEVNTTSAHVGDSVTYTWAATPGASPGTAIGLRLINSTSGYIPQSVVTVDAGSTGSSVTFTLEKGTPVKEYQVAVLVTDPRSQRWVAATSSSTLLVSA